MFSDEEKENWIKDRLKLLPKLIKMMDTYYHGEMKEKGIKEYEIEKEILEDIKILYLDEIIFDLTDEQTEELKKILERDKSSGRITVTNTGQSKEKDLE